MADLATNLISINQANVCCSSSQAKFHVSREPIRQFSLSFPFFVPRGLIDVFAQRVNYYLQFGFIQPNPGNFSIFHDITSMVPFVGLPFNGTVYHRGEDC